MLEELGGLDEGYHLYGEDIDLAYRAQKAGWERWYVPDAVVVHHHQAVTDRRFFTRRTLWHWRSIAPLRAQASREPAGALEAQPAPDRGRALRCGETEAHDAAMPQRRELRLDRGQARRSRVRLGRVTARPLD